MLPSTSSGFLHKDDCRPWKIEIHAGSSEAENRLVHGLGLATPGPAGLREAVERLHLQGYAGTVQYILAQAEQAGASRGRGKETRG